MKIKDKLEQVIFYLLAFSMIYISGTVSQQSGGTLISQIFIVLITTWLSFRALNKIKIRKCNWLCIVNILGLGLVLGTNSGIYYMNYIYKLFLFFSLLGTCYFMGQKEKNFEEILFRAFIILSVVSFCGFIFVNFMGKGNLSVPIGIYENFFGIYYYSTALGVNYGPLSYYRMAAVFWEPGVYAMYCSLALFYAMFVRKASWKNRMVIIFLFVNIFLTDSTTGFILLAILLAAYWILKAPFPFKQRILTGVIAVFIAMAVVFTVWIGKKNSMNVAYVNGVLHSSYSIRMLDLQAGFKIFLQYPIMGTGYYNISEFSKSIRMDRGNTNGIISWIFQMGIFGAIFLIYPFYKVHRKKWILRKSTYKGENKYVLFHLLYILIFFITNSSEPILTMPVMVYLLAREYYSFLHL